MKKIILTISIIFLLVSLLYTNTLATEGGLTITVNNTSNNSTNLIGNKIENKNTNNTNVNNTNKVNNTVNKTNKTNVNSSYRNTNLPNTGSEDFLIGFIIVAGVISAVYAYIKIKTYNI